MSGTGEYHYHHGCPPHLHTGGICPYDFADMSTSNSGGDSTSDTLVIVPVSIVLLLLWVGGRSLKVCKTRQLEKNMKRRRRVQWDADYNGKKFCDVFAVPDELSMDDSETPYLLHGPEDGLTVYITRRGGAYHKRECRYALNTSFNLWEVEDMGGHPCRVCHPPQYDFSWYWSFKRLKHRMNIEGVDIILENGIMYVKDKEAKNAGGKSIVQNSK